jgi:uncharacterized protein with HEPN domain
MSRHADKARIENMLGYIDDIETIITRHKGIPEALQDIEGEYALMMCLLQIGEILGKIETPAYKKKLPVKSSVGLRNLIAHDYEGIDLSLSQRILEEDIPALKEVIEEIMDENNTK